MKLSSVYVIKNREPGSLLAGRGFWNGSGWGSFADAMVYPPKDKAVQDLPTNGEWRQVTELPIEGEG